MIENYNTSADVRSYLDTNNINNAVVLCSAASLSNFIIHDCFKDNPNNTFLDIGSCLNPLLDLEGWKYTRGYLTGYWLNSGSPFGTTGRSMELVKIVMSIGSSYVILETWMALGRASYSKK